MYNKYLFLFKASKTIHFVTQPFKGNELCKKEITSNPKESLWYWLITPYFSWKLFLIDKCDSTLKYRGFCISSPISTSVEYVIDASFICSISFFKHLPGTPQIFLHHGNSPRCSVYHRVHRVATAAFWRTFSDEGKIGPVWWGWGVHAHPLSLLLPSPVTLQCTLQLSGQIHWPCFISTNICTLWCIPCTGHILAD